MTLSQDQKTWLSNNITTIHSSFDNFKNIRSHMGVYVTEGNYPYITFSTSNNFGATLKVGRKTNNLICVYICANDFNTQTNAFLA